MNLFSIPRRIKLSVEASARLAKLHGSSTIDASGRTYLNRMQEKAEKRRKP